MFRTWFGVAAVLAGACSVVAVAPGRVGAQVVAYQPGVGVAPDGVAMTAVPVVSADRRYVRVSVDAAFSTIDGFQNIGVPFAVSGLGSGGNAGAAFGGAGGGGGGPTGLRSVGVAMGMDGPVAGVMGGPPAWPAAGFAATGPGAAGYATARDDGSWSHAPARAKSSRSRTTAARQKRASTPPQPAAARPVAPKGR